MSHTCLFDGWHIKGRLHVGRNKGVSTCDKQVRRCCRLCSDGDEAGQSGEQLRSISTMTTEEWRALYENDGAVDLWVEEEFNSGSRLVVHGCWNPLNMHLGVHVYIWMGNDLCTGSGAVCIC